MNKKTLKTYGERTDKAMKTVVRLEKASLKITNLTINYLSKHNLTFNQFKVLEVLYHLGDLNIGSITNVGLSIDYEINRQKELLENGIKIVEETRRYDDKTNQTILMRTKETGNDYRYFPEPDLALLTLDDNYIEEVKSSLPELPNSLRIKYINLGINSNNIKTIIANKELCMFFENTINKCDS